MFRAATNTANGFANGVEILTPEIRWPLTPENLKLAGGEAHLFCAQLDLAKPRMTRLAEGLSAEEIARALRFHFEKDRNRFVAAHGQLREILGWLVNVPPKEIIFSRGERGKPQLADAINGQFLHFNLSHSDGIALIGVCRDCELGVDIERIRPVEMTEPLVTQFFSADELHEWFSLPSSRRAEVFFEHWTRTEAFLKFNGEGIGDFPNPFFQCEGDCRVQSLRPAANYSGAIVVETPETRLHCWKWISKNDCHKSPANF